MNKRPHTQHEQAVAIDVEAAPVVVTVACKQCGTKNRVSDRGIEGTYRCGSCKNALDNPFASPPALQIAALKKSVLPIGLRRFLKVGDFMDRIICTLISCAFCYLLGRMFVAEGIAALLWVPLGFVVGLFVTANTILLLMLGLPRAIRLVVKRKMRPSVIGRILFTPCMWLMPIFLLAIFWPSSIEFLHDKISFNLAAWLGTIAIVLSPLSKEKRSDFWKDFDDMCRPFAIENSVVSESRSEA